MGAQRCTHSQNQETNLSATFVIVLRRYDGGKPSTIAKQIEDIVRRVTEGAGPTTDTVTKVQMIIQALELGKFGGARREEMTTAVKVFEQEAHVKVRAQHRPAISVCGRADRVPGPSAGNQPKSAGSRPSAANAADTCADIGVDFSALQELKGKLLQERSRVECEEASLQHLVEKLTVLENDVQDVLLRPGDRTLSDLAAALRGLVEGLLVGGGDAGAMGEALFIVSQPGLRRLLLAKSELALATNERDLLVRACCLALFGVSTSIVPPLGERDACMMLMSRGCVSHGQCPTVNAKTPAMWCCALAVPNLAVWVDACTFTAGCGKKKSSGTPAEAPGRDCPGGYQAVQNTRA